MRLRETVGFIRKEYERDSSSWVIGYSGGKDSSLVLKLVFHAVKTSRNRGREVTVVYCDTGVEIPIVREFVYQSLARLALEVRAEGIPMRIDIAIPDLNDRFFVKVIGRGYPPPTNKFRWCTDRLRIDPIQRLLADRYRDAVVLLGVRRGESPQRDRTMRRHESRESRYMQQSGRTGTAIFAPIADFSTEDVWKALLQLQTPEHPDSRALLNLYRHADGECPVIRDDTSKPCAGARFGCWTCTVVRRDRAVEGLVSEGFERLAPLLEYRNWLAAVRSDSRFRENKRRNGAPGPGPITLEGRRLMLDRLRTAEVDSGYQLISDEEVSAIESLWKLDETPPSRKGSR